MARPLGHRQTKETATDKPDLRLPRHISTLPRTKAHGYVHSCMEHPVYVKITGPAGALLPGTEAPLVVHQKDARKLEACGILPRGVTLELSPYKSAGLLKFRESGTTATPQGRDMSITDLSALDALLQLLMAVRPRGVAPRVAAQSPDSAGRNSDDEPEPPLPDTHEAIAAASAIDEDPRCRDESPTVRLALINARLGQGGYRQRMLKLWEGRCSVTGMSISTTIKSIQDIMRKDVGVDRRRAAHRPAGLDVLPEDLRRQGKRIRTARRRLPLADPRALRWRNWAADAEGITGDELLDFVNNQLFPTLKNLQPAPHDQRGFVIRSVFEDAYNYMKSGT
jgi:hypothetical protein